MINRAMTLLVLAVITGCATPTQAPQSQMEIQAYQSREFEATKRVAFDSTMSVLQDAGFIIESADFETGFITGKGTTTSSLNIFTGPKNEFTKMTAFVEQRTSSLARIRVNLVQSTQRKSSWNNMQDVIEDKEIRDPKIYQDLFANIDQAIFIKKNL